MALKPAIFIDKDGTLVENVPYNVERARIRLAPGAVEALARFDALGYELVIVSNQPGVALGRFPPGALLAVEEHLDDLLVAQGLRLAACYWCPHHPDGTRPEYALACTCRKPLPGLLQAAARERGLDLERSWMVGDILDDVEAGNRAGCRTILVDVGNETEWVAGAHRKPHHVVPDLRAAAGVVAARHALSRPPAAAERAVR